MCDFMHIPTLHSSWNNTIIKFKVTMKSDKLEYHESRKMLNPENEILQEKQETKTLSSIHFFLNFF